MVSLELIIEPLWEMAQLTGINLGTGRTATAIATGEHQNCVVLDNGAVKCWGRNTYGQLGIDNTNHRGGNHGAMGDNLPAVNLGTGRTATAIAAGHNHSCAVLDNGAVKCWGLNNYGQLGIDNTQNKGNNQGDMAQLTGIDLGTGRTATAIAAGNLHTCAKLDNGDFKCWGLNNTGQLGINNSITKGNNANEMASLPPVNL